jgi:cellulose synthase/poly-beta-1,6-N-acetylglucosamine synthase-like glycosyltransferase
MEAVRIIFIVSFSLLFWTFVLYPLVLLLIGRVRRGTRIQKAPLSPAVTVIVPTYQEATVVKRRILNLVESNYPLDELEVYIVDSASTDGTPDVVKSFMLERPDLPIHLLEEDERRGLVSALNLGLKAARGEIIISTDGPTLYGADTIRHVSQNFADPRVGAVTGRFGFPKRDSDVNRAEGVFWDFKNILRELESAVDSTPHVTGELCAFRKDLIDDLGNASADDMYVAYRIRELGYRVVADPQAVYYEKKPATFGELQSQKTKSVQVGLIESWRFRHMLFRPRYGLFGLLIFPTKVLFTPLSPLVLIVAAISGLLWLLLAFGWAVLLGGLGLALGGGVLLKVFTGRNVFRIGAAFLFNEWIILRAFFKWISGTFDPRWEKADSVRQE